LGLGEFSHGGHGGHGGESGRRIGVGSIFEGFAPLPLTTKREGFSTETLIGESGETGWKTFCNTPETRGILW
jgi:hypothetical protein